MLTAKKIKRIRELAEKGKARREAGLYLVEGARGCEMLHPEDLAEVYVTQGFLDCAGAERCRHLLRGAELISEPEMKKLSDTLSPQGILCLVKMPAKKTPGELLTGREGENAFLLVLETIQDPGNLGTILRAAEAAGCSGVLMNDTTVDPYSPKVVRSSMGSLFRVPIRVTGQLREEVREIRNGSFTGGRLLPMFAASPAATLDYTRADFTSPCGILIGNEAAGLSDILMQEANFQITIPMKGEIESLNAAMATAVIAFEAARQRRF